MGTGAGNDIPIDPDADEHRLGYLDIPREDDIGAKVLCEFDLWDAQGLLPVGVGQAKGLAFC
jgi:hypothetical protein